MNFDVRSGIFGQLAVPTQYTSHRDYLSKLGEILPLPTIISTSFQIFCLIIILAGLLRRTVLAATPSAKGTGQKTWLSSALGYTQFIPGFLIGILVGLMVDLPKRVKSLPAQEPSREKRREGELRGGARRGVKSGSASRMISPSPTSIEGGELKMVLVVRLDLKMGSGKIASQCAHAAVGTYEECLSRGQKFLLKKWEDCGQAKIVVTCKSQNEMNELRAKAERAGLPVFTVADAGRTQVAAGSNTVLAIGPGVKATVDSITQHLKLL